MPGTAAFEEAAAFFASGLAAGRTASQLLIDAANYLNGDVAPAFTDIAAQFQNKIAVSTYFSVERADIEELDVAALKAVVADVTAEEASVYAAIEAIEAINTVGPPENHALRLLNELQNAYADKATFLAEDALASELVLAQLEDYEPQEEAQQALEEGELTEQQIEQAIDDALNLGVNDALLIPVEPNEGQEVELEIEQPAQEAAGAKVLAQQELDDVNDAVEDTRDTLRTFNDDDTFEYDNQRANIDSFASSSRTIQNTLIAETELALNEALSEVGAAVGTVTGLAGRVNVLQTRKAELEAALEEESDADDAYEIAETSVKAINSDIARLNDAEFNFQNGTFAAPAVIEPLAAEVIFATREEGGTWVAQSGLQEATGVEDFLAALTAHYNAQQAVNTAEALFKTAINRAVEAEAVEGGTLGVTKMATTLTIMK